MMIKHSSIYSNKSFLYVFLFKGKRIVREMNTLKFDGFQVEGDIYERNHDDSDEYSSSESCNNTNNAISPRAKKKTKLPSSMRSGFVIAEENRREKNMQRNFHFRELSSVVPGLNMKDEDLMLGDAIDYLKRLKERSTILEEQNKNICIEKAWVFGDNDIGESFSSTTIYKYKKGLPEIEAKAQEKNVLIRVHCENQKGYIAKVIGEIEKLYLNVDNISSLPFGDYLLDITVTAQISEEFSMTMKDLKRELKEALQLFM